MGKAMKVGNKDGFGAVKRKDGWLRAKIGQVCIISTICIICFICIICIICGASLLLPPFRKYHDKSPLSV